MYNYINHPKHLLVNAYICIFFCQDFFSEASLCQDEMEQVSELSDKLFTTLDSNDTQTLQQSLSSVSKRFSHIPYLLGNYLQNELSLSLRRLLTSSSASSSSCRICGGHFLVYSVPANSREEYFEIEMPLVQEMKFIQY